MNWTRYLSIVFNDTNVVLNPKKDTAILLDLPYLQKLSNLIKKSDKLVLGKLNKYFIIQLLFEIWFHDSLSDGKT